VAEVFTKVELIDASKAFIKINDFVENLKASTPAARCINNSKLPERISESLVYHLISNGKITFLNGLNTIKIRFNEKARKHIGTNSKPTDIILDLLDGTECLIEVKATQVGYTEIKQKDADANFLIWVEFNDSFRGGSNKNVQISALKIPNNMKAKQYNWKPYHEAYPSANVATYASFEDVLSDI
jgi:hypothetical protein